jgi:hypothetical protein
MSLLADIVTVYHNDRNYQQYLDLKKSLLECEPDGNYSFIGVDNRVTNRGFALGCNIGAFARAATAPVIAFLNPDVTVSGPFLQRAIGALEYPIVITGCRFGKPQPELNAWGVADWVCGAAMFVTRDWFTAVGGFDVGYVWSWEETDLIRRAQAQGLRCRSIDLPIAHASPESDNPQDSTYKNTQFERSAQRFRSKWGKP